MNPITPYDYLAYRALQNPFDPVLVMDGNVTSFAELNRMVRGAAAKLRDLGIKPGQTVAIYHDDPVVSLALIFALQHEGVTSYLTHVLFKTITIDVVLAAAPVADLPDIKTHLIDRAWLDEAAKSPPEITPQPFPDMSAICMLFSSSGTTGDPKAIPVTLEVIDNRLRTNMISKTPIGAHLCLLSFRTAAGFAVFHRCMATGFAMYVTDKPQAALREIILGHVMEITASPAHLAFFVKSLAGRSIRLPRLQTIYTAGAPIHAALLNRIRVFLCGNVINVYGSSEGGPTCVAPAHAVASYPGGSGYAEPGVEIEIVDDQDQPMPLGEEGIVRSRSNTIIKEYLGDPETSAKTFRDGWFYPGDLGRIERGNLLVVTGRANEAINVGGLKINPALIDTFLCDQPGIEDGAAFATADKLGNAEIWAGVVSATPIDETALLAVAKQQLGAKRPRRIIQIDEVPRNATGKIERIDLREKAEQALLTI
jgi:acyl-coenzyme A synthetase/AMP-(fatty) acid ligase